MAQPNGGGDVRARFGRLRPRLQRSASPPDRFERLKELADEEVNLDGLRACGE